LRSTRKVIWNLLWCTSRTLPRVSNFFASSCPTMLLYCNSSVEELPPATSSFLPAASPLNDSDDPSHSIYMPVEPDPRSSVTLISSTSSPPSLSEADATREQTSATIHLPVATTTTGSVAPASPLRSIRPAVLNPL
jgi:hypothetical protein